MPHWRPGIGCSDSRLDRWIGGRAVLTTSCYFSFPLGSPSVRMGFIRSAACSSFGNSTQEPVDQRRELPGVPRGRCSARASRSSRAFPPSGVSQFAIRRA
jgi:hypothetical protein